MSGEFEELSACSAPKRRNSKKKSGKSRPKKAIDLDDFKAVRRAYELHNDLDTAIAFVKSMDLVVDSPRGVVDTCMDDLINRKIKEAQQKSAPKESRSSKECVVSIHATAYASLNSKSKPSKREEINVDLCSVHVGADTLFKEQKLYSPNPGHVHGMRDIFSLHGMDSNEAEVILVSGGPGSGKTLMLKYILEHIGKSEELIPGLDAYEIVFVADLRLDKYSNFADLASAFLYKKAGFIPFPKDNVKAFVLSMKVLILLDSFDESVGDSLKMLKEILDIDGKDVTIIITCRPQYVESLYRLIPKRKRKQLVHLGMNPLLMSNLIHFICRLVDHKFRNKDHKMLRTLIADGLIRRLPEIYNTFGDELLNPLMFTIIAGMWFEHPVIEIRSGTNTQKLQLG
ncbi:uncharacterized protein [Macrobrachium rosenbergii]|uniref:uncharacterized protein n=1 Tax=Macrobrachium rosenbergii TaxID=79674 RepID=UPI0034D3EE28